MQAARKILAAGLLTLAGATVAQAQVADKKSITLDGARRVIAAAKAEAHAKNAPGAVIAVVDDGGNLVAVERLDGTFAAGATISAGKARTAALFKRSTKAFEDIIRNGRTRASLPGPTGWPFRLTKNISTLAIGTTSERS